MTPPTLLAKALRPFTLMLALGAAGACNGAGEEDGDGTSGAQNLQELAAAASLPTIRIVAPAWEASSRPKVLSAVITQGSGPLGTSLRARCDFSFKTQPTEEIPIRSVAAARLAANTFSCTLPDALAIQSNHVLRYEWVIESGAPAVTVARSGTRDFQVGCADPAEFLREEQRTVLSRFGRLSTQAEILGHGYLPAHVTTATLPVKIAGLSLRRPFIVNKIFTGMGAAFAKVQSLLPSDVPQAGAPSLLLFAPSATVEGEEDLAHPSATYRLIGWAYSANLAAFPAERTPSVGCFPLHEWFFHEKGVHTLDGGFSPGAPTAAGLPHQRLWDLHVWADLTTGVPRLGILNVTGAGGAVTPDDGYEAPAGSFFYPALPRP